LFPFEYLEGIYKIFPYPYNICAIIIFLFSFIIYECQNKYKIGNIKKSTKQYLHKNSKEFKYISIAIISLIFIFCGYHYLEENYIFPEPPLDKFRIAISPFYVANYNPDSEAADELRQEIENSTDGKIDAILLDEPAITDDKEASLRGKKASSHIVVYGIQTKKYGNIDESIEFHIVPINLESIPPQSEVFNINSKQKFNAMLSPANPTISINDSLSENVSSTVYALCALEYYNKFDFISAIKTFKIIKNYENKADILLYIGNCYY